MARVPLVYIGSELVAETTGAIAEATGSALQKNADQFTRGLFRALQKEAIPDARMYEANIALARRAQKAITDGWRARLSEPPTAPYRANRGRLTGALGSALASGSMIERTNSRAISFLNTSTLKREARHWYRVNYGARGPLKSPARPRPHTISIDGHTVAELEDPGKPARNSWLPRRFTIDEATGELTPTRLRGPLQNKADVPGGGHRAALFSELGFRSLAANLEFEYREMLNRWVAEEGAEAVRRALHAQGVRIPAHVLAGG